MFKSVKIATRLILGFLFVATLVAAVSIFSFHELKKIEAPLTNDIPQGLKEIERTSHLDGLAQRIRYYDQVLTECAKNYATTGDKKWKYRYKNTEPLLDAIIREAIAKGDEEDKQTFSEVQKAKLLFVELESQSLAAVDSGNRTQAVDILENITYWQLKEEYKAGLERYIERRGKKYGDTLEVTSTKVDAMVQKAHELVQESIRLLTIISLAALIFSVMLSLLVSRSILNPLKKLQKGAELIGRGNLNHKIRAESKDEIGELALAFNDMTHKLKESYSGLEEKVQEKTSELARKVDEIAKQNKELEETKHAILRVLQDLEVAKSKIEKEKVESQALLTSIGDGMIATDPEGKVRMLNRPAELMFGLKSEEIVGRSFAEVFPIEDAKGKPLLHEERPLPIALSTKKKVMTTAIYVRKDKTKFPAAVTVSPITLDGKCIGAIEIVRDITKEKEVDRMKTEFISTVSHELRTPLTVIREGVSLVIDGMLGETTEKQKKFLRIALQDIDRLKRIIDNLLDISKIEAGKVDLKRERINLAELAQNVMSIFQARAVTQGLKLKKNFDQEIEIYLDKDKVVQVFTNLIGNALKFTEKGHIEIGIVDRGTTVECYVADTGKGIAEEDLSKVFQKFQQFGRTYGAGEKGTGLGLTIAKGIVELHNGKMWVESKLNEGTKFIFAFPKFGAQDLLKEYVSNYLRDAMEHRAPLSIIAFDLEDFGVLGRSIGQERTAKVMQGLEALAKTGLRRQLDVTIRDGKMIYVVLPHTEKENAAVVAKRIHESFESFIAQEGLAGVGKVSHKVITYPEDGNTHEALLHQAAA